MPDIIQSVDKMTPKISEIIQDEVNSGIPTSRIIVGGLSMGGGMSLHFGYRAHPELRGIFALSSFLSENSPVYDEIRARRQANSDATMPELFMAHGTRDELVLYEWGKQTFDKLQSLGVKGQFHEFNYDHDIGPDELITLRNWVTELLPNI